MIFIKVFDHLATVYLSIFISHPCTMLSNLCPYETPVETGTLDLCTYCSHDLITSRSYLLNVYFPW